MRRSRERGATTLLVRDGGAVVAELVRAGAALEGLEVRPASLDEALAELVPCG